VKLFLFNIFLSKTSTSRSLCLQEVQHSRFSSCKLSVEFNCSRRLELHLYQMDKRYNPPSRSYTKVFSNSFQFHRTSPFLSPKLSYKLFLY